MVAKRGLPPAIRLLTERVIHGRDVFSEAAAGVGASSSVEPSLLKSASGPSRAPTPLSWATANRLTINPKAGIVLMIFGFNCHVW